MYDPTKKKEFMSQVPANQRTRVSKFNTSIHSDYKLLDEGDVS